MDRRNFIRGTFTAALILPHGRGLVGSLRAGVVNVRDFGARGDGTTDDTGAVLRALSEMGEGDTLWFPGPSVYLVDAVDLGRFGHAGLELAGEPGAVIRKHPGGTFGSTNREHIFFDTSSDGSTDGLRVRDLEFELSSASASPGESVSAFFLGRVDDVRFERCGFIDGVEEGLKLYKCRDVLVDRCTFERIRNDGVQVHAPPTRADGYSGPRADRGWRNVTISNSRFIAIDDQLGGVEGQGVTFNSREPTVTCGDGAVLDCEFDRCVRGVWAEVNDPGVRVTGLRFDRNRVVRSVTIGLGVVGVDRASISHNEVLDPVGAAARSDALAGIVVSGSSSPRPRSTAVRVEGNRVLDRRGVDARMPVGIVVRQADDVTLAANEIRGATRDSILVDATAREVRQS